MAAERKRKMDNKVFIQKCRQEIGDLKKEIKRLQNKLDDSNRQIEILKKENFELKYQKD